MSVSALRIAESMTGRLWATLRSKRLNLGMKEEVSTRFAKNSRYGRPASQESKNREAQVHLGPSNRPQTSEFMRFAGAGTQSPGRDPPASFHENEE